MILHDLKLGKYDISTECFKGEICQDCEFSLHRKTCKCQGYLDGLWDKPDTLSIFKPWISHRSPTWDLKNSHDPFENFSNRMDLTGNSMANLATPHVEIRCSSWMFFHWHRKKNGDFDLCFKIINKKWVSHFVAKTTNQFSNFCISWPGVPKSILFGTALEQFICWAMAIGRSLIFSIDGEVGQKYTLILGKSIAYRWTFKIGYFSF